jgi:hypothetical protein
MLGNIYPLYLACAHVKSEPVIKLLLIKYPKAAEELICFGMYPLHEACKGGQSESVIKLSLKAYPAAINHKVMGGCNPLDLARQHNASHGVIQLLEEYLRRENGKDQNIVNKVPEKDTFKEVQVETNPLNGEYSFSVFDSKPSTNKVRCAFIIHSLSTYICLHNRLYWLRSLSVPKY